MAKRQRFAVPDSDEEFESLLETEPTVLLLRVCREDLTSFKEYQWPGVGKIARPKAWLKKAECGNGLHGWLWGKGDSATAIWEQNNVALVVRALERTVVNLRGKVKVPACRVEFVGTLEEAAEWIEERLPKGEDPGGIIGRVVTAGDWETAAAGDYGKAIAGFAGTATAGSNGTATVEYGGIATVREFGSAIAGADGTAYAGICGTATAGDHGMAIARTYGKATAGDYGTAIAGDHGVATAGDGGTAIAGEFGQAIAGDDGRATAGFAGTVTAGHGGILVLQHWDSNTKLYRLHVAHVGEDGIEANVAYRLDSEGRFKKVQE